MEEKLKNPIKETMKDPLKDTMKERNFIKALKAKLDELKEILTQYLNK